MGSYVLTLAQYSAHRDPVFCVICVQKQLLLHYHQEKIGKIQRKIVIVIHWLKLATSIKIRAP